MKVIGKLTILLLCLVPFYSTAQEGGMVNWKFSGKKVADQLYEFTAKAVVAEGWHIYAQDSGEGSLPTKFNFTANPSIKLEGKVLEKGTLVTKRNEVMDSELKYYADSVSFVQRVKLVGKPHVNFSGTIAFMTCNDEMCLPEEEVNFKVQLK